jgi:predicted transporter
MTLVLVIAHVHMMLKKREDRVRYIGGLISVIVALLLVYVGVSILPQGWVLAI